MTTAAIRWFKTLVSTAAMLAAGLYFAFLYHDGRIAIRSDWVVQFHFSDYFFPYRIDATLAVQWLGAIACFAFYAWWRPGRSASRPARALAIAAVAVGFEYLLWTSWVGPLPLVWPLIMVLVAVGLLIGWGLSGGRLLEKIGDGAGRVPVWAIVIAGAIVGTVVCDLSWRWVFKYQTIMSDAQSQIGQARLLLTGHFTHPYAQPLRDVLEIPYAIAKAPAYSQFPPGYVLAMVPAIGLGLPPQIVTTLFGGVMVALAAWLAVRLAGRAAGIAVVILLAGSPFMWAMGGSAMNHVACGAMLTAAAFCWLPMVQEPERDDAWWRIVLGGLALGFAVTMRPLTGLAHGAVWGMALAVMFAGSLRGGAPEWMRRLPRRLLPWGALGLAIPAAMFMFYNLHTTGRALTMAYSTSNPAGHVLGFRDWGPVPYSKIEALHHFAASVFSLNRMLFGWAIGSWTAMLIWWYRTHLSRAEWIMFGLIVSQFFLYGLYHFFDLFLGPRFLFELLPLIAVLAALGLWPVLRRGGAAAGATLVVLALFVAVSFGRIYEIEPTRYSVTVAQSQKLDRFMKSLEPRRGPMVILVDKPFNELVGDWFPAIGDEQPIYFVLKENAERARRFPELRKCEWREFNFYGSE